jgi:hypothetical protein
MVLFLTVEADMCVVSMVMDHFEPKIPQDWWPQRVDFIEPVPTPLQTFVVPAPIDAATVEALRAEIAKLVSVVTEFKAAVEAARKVDALTAQPDCEDTEKAKLEARVAELERRLDAVSKALGA